MTLTLPRQQLYCHLGRARRKREEICEKWSLRGDMVMTFWMDQMWLCPALYYCTAMCKIERPPTGWHVCWQPDDAVRKTASSFSMWLVLRTLQKKDPKVQQPITSQWQLSKLINMKSLRKQGPLLLYYQIFSHFRTTLTFAASWKVRALSAHSVSACICKRKKLSSPYTWTIHTQNAHVKKCI